MKCNETDKECCRPQSTDTGDVVLPESLMPLIEALAENVHDTWAKGRIDEGWTYGPVRDDARKQHPCLVPYSDLPESEKAYDRATAISTLKFICKMGYRIGRP
ncbi:MAG: Ryanodine receptor Ryr [Kiritimatiellae bacterium]|nr:Ryanodine receptor Ryr [Kiritimatiellia bacterium]